MKIIEVQNRSPILISKLVEVWENSVKATHSFLSTAEIENIKQYVPPALKRVPVLAVIISDVNEPTAFMGIDNKRLEMLFVVNNMRGRGLGKLLLNYGIEKYGVNELTVNEQNPCAEGFYEHMGFKVYKRSDLDEQGNPYPILYMRSAN